ncbi:Nif3-like dinuclear metal center hexameric protein [Arcanobacterium bovis]|uniref:GTP cyclohydrolase 1 type 2 homolog n=1 Tax=Arcanobacterium bovis TaxID=2529275 RepID=A0A4V2KR81_9ACTO|nr:Nif3-like dinuclear metal center hexameric protein [Arcanobacterium bovis]TBW22799.1 Nif3-like dinuclear metal center hexameric protein [Arcanobacterium bovis]
MSVTVEHIVRAMNKHYPASFAEDWDRVGLVVGDLAAPVKLIGFAVDPCEATVNEAIERGADMLITHHPLFLRGTSSVATDSAKGSWVHKLIKNDCALFAAHTNADAAADGSAVALADLLGVEDQRPLQPHSDFPQIGIGRVGTLPMTMSVLELAERVKAKIPDVPAGITIGGDPARIVKTVAVSPGSGDSFLKRVGEVGADVYITADLRHHPATDHLWSGGCALIGTTHFASEWPVLPNLQRRIEQECDVQTYVSTIITDPWEIRL